jgi:hypothetical protein
MLENVVAWWKRNEIAESEMSDTKHFAYRNLKEIAVLVPVLGTAIAITYDVGFF